MRRINLRLAAQQQQWPAAKESAEAAFDLLETKQADDLDIAVSRQAVSAIRSGRRQSRGGKDEVQKALAIRQKVFGDNHYLVAESQAVLARVNSLKDDDAESQRLFQAALQTETGAFGDSSPHVADVLEAMADAHAPKRRPTKQTTRGNGDCKFATLSGIRRRTIAAEKVPA